jgi:hypothetical protein
MIFEYENRVLLIENAEGLRWQLSDVEKPQFAFDYDALYMSKERVFRRVGSHVHPLTKGEINQVEAFVEHLPPPPWAGLQTQTIVNLRAPTAEGGGALKMRFGSPSICFGSRMPRQNNQQNTRAIRHLRGE